MVHYPNQILRHGPLVCSWTMQHEAKLNFFKQASCLCNFKNLTLTPAKRHQLWLAYQIHTKTLFNDKSIRGPILQSSQLKDEDGELITLIQNAVPGCTTEDLVTRLKRVQVRGLKYMPNNAFVVISVDNGGMPLFGKLTEIQLINSSTLLLLVIIYNTVQFTDSLFTYTITPTHNINVLDVNKIKYPQVIHSFKVEHVDHVSPSYYVC